MKITAAVTVLLMSASPMLVTSLGAEAQETVMITFHAKPGAESKLAGAIERHWETVKRLNMVTDQPHVTLKGTESSDKTYFVEILTWRDASIRISTKYVLSELSV